MSKRQQSSNSQLFGSNTSDAQGQTFDNQQVPNQEEEATLDKDSSDIAQSDDIEQNGEVSDKSSVETNKKLAKTVENNEETDSLEGKYVGSATNLTFNETTGLSIRISQSGSTIGGRVNIGKPALGSGNIISGYVKGKSISFISYDSKNDITISIGKEK